MKKLSKFLWKPEADAQARSGPLIGAPHEALRIAPELAQVRAVEVQIEPAARLIFQTDSRSPGADRFRFLRLKLREHWQTGRLRTLLITSPLPGDGKSTVALNLASVLAEKGKRNVLLIDADLHQRTLAATLGLPDGPGLADCLEDNVDPVSILRRVDPLGFFLLSSGATDHNPAELLQTESLSRITKKLASLFDWVLIDTPPVVPLTDALLLSRHADASLVVVRADITPRDAVEEALSLLGRQHVLGIVLNGAEGLDRRYARYSQYYGQK